jgi:hypothetical protein
MGAISAALQASNKGRTQLISLPKIPAEELERELTKIVDQG